MVATFMWKQLLVAGSLSAVLFTVSFLISTWNDKIIQIAGFLSGVAAMTNGVVPYRRKYPSYLLEFIIDSLRLRVVYVY